MSRGPSACQARGMRQRSALVVLLAVLAGGAAFGFVMLGRATASASASRQDGYRSGYADGLQAGTDQGRREGRALQEGAELPPAARRPVHDAFDAGYVAGANDAFGNYDGGWAYRTRYVITLEPGSNGVTYRIVSRALAQ